MELLTVLPDLVRLVDEAPEADEVKAGWVALGLFLGLAVAIALLGWSLIRQLRKAQAAQEAGLYDPSDKRRPGRRGPTARTDAAEPTDGSSTETPESRSEG